MNELPDFPVPIPETQLATQFAALAHPARIAILRHLACIENCCCKDMVERLDLAQSTVSQHLKILVSAGLIQNEPVRQWSHYRLDRQALSLLLGNVEHLVDACCQNASLEKPGPKPVAR